MKTIQDKTQAALQGLRQNLSESQEKTSNKTDLPTNWVSALFLKFQRRYPHKWASAIDGDEEGTIKEWANYLAGLTGEQIKHGLESWDEDWPPSAIEFRKCCLGEGKKLNEHGLDYVPEYLRERITDKSRLLKSKTHAERVEIKNNHMTKIKDMLMGRE